MKKKAPHKPTTRKGRPTKYHESYPNIIAAMTRMSMTHQEIMNALDISHNTFHQWLKEYPLFKESLKETEIKANSKVEYSLFQRACGIEVTDTEELITEVDGVIKKSIKRIKRHIPPDTTAQIFWLKNRMPARWRDVHKIEGEVGITMASFAAQYMTEFAECEVMDDGGNGKDGGNRKRPTGGAIPLIGPSLDN